MLKTAKISLNAVSISHLSALHVPLFILFTGGGKGKASCVISIDL